MTEKQLGIEEYLAPPSVWAKWVSEFLKWYVMLLKDCDEEELEELFDLIRFDWKTFKGEWDD